MSCPPEIARILLQILTHAALHIRVLGGNGEAHRCAIVADHIHNLPDLIANYSPELLRFYWTVEKPIIEREFPTHAFKSLWDELSPFVENDSPVDASSST
jgi:hypothetical protein